MMLKRIIDWSIANKLLVLVLTAFAVVAGVIAVMRTPLEALAERERGDVLLASHDSDFAPQVAALVRGGGRRVGVLCFRELVSSALADLVAEGLELYDLEDDVGAFTVTLPRTRVIPIERFDPWSLLD